MPKMSDTITIVIYNPLAFRGQRSVPARFTNALGVRA
jgi:hypothetical protein